MLSLLKCLNKFESIGTSGFQKNRPIPTQSRIVFWSAYIALFATLKKFILAHKFIYFTNSKQLRSMNAFCNRFPQAEHFRYLLNYWTCPVNPKVHPSITYWIDLNVCMEWCVFENGFAHLDLLKIEHVGQFWWLIQLLDDSIYINYLLNLMKKAKMFSMI